jgi:hypothetical protein
MRPWVLETFGQPVYRVALDAGSSCPNRDGSKGRGGCVYCDVEGSGTGALRSGRELERQFALGLARIARREPAASPARAVAYFQSYSNTYVDPDRLRETLDCIEPHLAANGGPVVALAIATRPDTLPDAALAVLGEWNARLPVWLELGLESADDRILTEINRLHTVDDFRLAVRRAHATGLLVIGHAILGLPGDGRDGARRTAEVLTDCGVSGVKVHHLMVLEKTVLAQWWRAGRVEPLSVERYVDWLADFVERLDPSQVLHRITGDAPSTQLLAPIWPVAKNRVREFLEAELERRGTRQGSRAGSAPS